MQILKKEKAHKDMLKSIRAPSEKTSPDSYDEEIAENSSETEQDECLERQIYSDEKTVGRFGSAVTVVIDRSISTSSFPDATEEADDDMDESTNNAIDDDVMSIGRRSVRSSTGSTDKHGKKPLTRLEKALKKAKEQMGNSKRSNGKDKTKVRVCGDSKSARIFRKASESKLKGKSKGHERWKAHISSSRKSTKKKAHGRS